MYDMSTPRSASTSSTTWLGLSAEVTARRASLGSLARRREVRDDAPPARHRSATGRVPAPRAKAA